MLPSLEYFNNGQQLHIVGLIPSLSRNHLSREKDYRIPLAQIIWGQLTKNPTHSIVRSICLNFDMTLWIKMMLYWGLNKCLFQFGKSLLALDIRNDPDWLLMFLAFEASGFLTQIHFLVLAIFWLFGWSLRLCCASFLLSQSSIWISLPFCSSSPTSTENARPSTEFIFSMEVNGVAILLNPLMNRR